MKNTLVVLAVLISMFASSLPASAQMTGQMPIDGLQPVKNFLLPFQSDGCTGWIDSSLGRDYTSCCLEHDIKYWIGGTELEKLETDKALQKCVGKKSSKLMGTLMFVFVWMWGKLDSTDVTRWGNGWNYLRYRYQPVTDEERTMGIASQPPDLTSAVRKYWSKEKRAATKIETYQAEPYPTVLGNYCLDEVGSKLARKAIELGKPNLKLDYRPHDNLKNTYRIRTNLCPEEMVATFQVTQLSMCEEPVWGVRPSHFLSTMTSYGACGKLLESLKNKN
jgi:hypothetical protein